MIADRPTPTAAPLSPTVEALLSHERIVLDKPELVRARVLARARASLQLDNVVPLMPRRSPARIRRLVFATAAGVAVAASVAAAYQVMMGHAPPTPPARGSTQPPAQLAPTPPRSAESALGPATPAPGVMTAPKPVPSERANLARKDDKTVEELRLLDSARQASARGEYGSVLALTREHERSYPNGRLTEEREVLRVKALVGLGRIAEARQAAARFRRHFPRSVLLPTIQDMVTSDR